MTRRKSGQNFGFDLLATTTLTMPSQMEARCLIEFEGGIWVNGRHNRAAGFNADLEKYLEASLAGWRVFRLGPDQITMENVERLVRVIHAPTCPAFQASAIKAGSVCSEM
jgi:hypothetical protein